MSGVMTAFDSVTTWKSDTWFILTISYSLCAMSVMWWSALISMSPDKTRVVLNRKVKIERIVWAEWRSSSDFHCFQFLGKLDFRFSKSFCDPYYILSKTAHAYVTQVKDTFIARYYTFLYWHKISDLAVAMNVMLDWSEWRRYSLTLDRKIIILEWLSIPVT